MIVLNSSKDLLGKQHKALKTSLLNVFVAAYGYLLVSHYSKSYDEIMADSSHIKLALLSQAFSPSVYLA